MMYSRQTDLSPVVRRAAPGPAVDRMRSTPSGDRSTYASDEGAS